jgi:hypothetical protein
MTAQTARLKVRRGAAAEPAPRYDEFAVPFGKARRCSTR